MMEIDTRSDLEIRYPYDYFCLVGKDEWRVVNSVPLKRLMLSDKEDVKNSFMGIRLSSGIIGELDCPAVNIHYIPKGHNEVILGYGQEGIKALLELGALPCIACHSGLKLINFGNGIADTLKKSIDDLKNADDISWLTQRYDSRRLNWEKLVDLGISPGRFYTRPGLESGEIVAVKEIFTTAGLTAPTIGYYDARQNGDPFVPYST